jgi:hypothetical protein
MARCCSCSAENPDRNRFCGGCGAALGSATELPTDVMPHASMPSPSGSFDEGRFPSGTVLAERYRVVGLIGQGGMGEVYRANDLKLGQPVALKFQPAATAKNSQLLTRFHAEVRIARPVSHPNVCRLRYRRSGRLHAPFDGVRGWRRPPLPAAPHRTPPRR